MRPPLISTDIADLLLPLLASRRDGHLRLVPLLAGQIETLLLEDRVRRAREVDSIRLVPRRLLQLRELLRDPRRPLVVGRVHDPDPERCRPDERIDLVHLPRLVSAGKRRARLQDDVDAVAPMVAAVD